MNHQQLFSTSAKHLLSQQRRAVDSNGECAYRADDGSMCAVGVLIPQALYSADLEGQSIQKIISDLPEIKHALGVNDAGGLNFTLLCRVQYIHDNVDPAEWLGALEALAGQFNLEFDRNGSGTTAPLQTPADNQNSMQRHSA